MAIAGMAGLNVLVVDDERELRESLNALLRAMGHQVFEAENGEKALKCLYAVKAQNRGPLHIVLLDVNMPGLNGLEVLKRIRAFDPLIKVLIITAHGNIKDAVAAMREGAYNYIEKPVREADIQALIEKATEAYTLVKKMSLSSPKMPPKMVIDEGEEFIGSSQEMRGVFEVITRVAPVNTSVIIRGENGTGKELVARAIHFNSPRKDKRFIAINCGAIPENLVESEFFGHEKGAFTGAIQRHIGKFQSAEGGTLFLDEIAELSLTMQVKLLRVLQERNFMPVGSNREIRCDVRIIAATNRDLEKMIAEGRFRQDLFYRLNVMPIELPPLRDRVDDIPSLVQHFIEKFNSHHSRSGSLREITGIKEDALNALKNYTWPGNIRELENTIERAFVLENGGDISAASLSEHIQPETLRTAAPDLVAIDFHNQKEQFEKDFIISALKRFNGRINQTVAHAGIPKNTLLRKIKKYGLSPSDYGNVDEEGEERLSQQVD